MWFVICRRHYRNHKYCGPECRKAARRKSNQDQDKVYARKAIGRIRRALASAGYRRRQREKLAPPPAIEESDRADYPAIGFPVTRSCPRRGACVICGFSGPVTAHSP